MTAWSGNASYGLPCPSSQPCWRVQLGRRAHWLSAQFFLRGATACVPHQHYAIHHCLHLQRILLALAHSLRF
eukprot:COSAG03_NODE_730_length_6062_cov_9.830790_1_plen_72_part_00